MGDEVELNSPPMNSAVMAMQSVIMQNATIRAGRNALITERKTYMVQLETQSDEQFEAMVKMAPMYILFPKVVDGFSGTVFAKAPVMKGIEFDEKQKEYNINCDMLGNSIDEFSQKIVDSVFEDGFCASINDYSDTARRPFMRFVHPKQFRSFRTDSNKGYPVISRFIYIEEIEVDDPDDEFDVHLINQYTVMDLARHSTDKEGVKSYRVRKYRSIPNDTVTSNATAKVEKIIQHGDEIFPIMDGKRFESLPITIHGVASNNFTVGKSPLQDISDMNISVIQRVIDQVYMLHWTALPTPWVTGCDDDDAPATIGPSKVWHITNDQAKVGMLEFSGSSAKAHQDFIDNLKDIMASMGAQILKKEGVSRETATSVLVRTAAQTSLISTIVKNLSGQIKNSLTIFFTWSKVKVKPEFSYELNDDFVKVDMEPNAQIALVKSWLDGAISHETMFNKMKEGELVDANITFDEEIERIKKNPPPFYAKKLDHENAMAQAKATAKLQETNDGKKPDGEGNNKDDGTKGSNLDNGNINNTQTD